MNVHHVYEQTIKPLSSRDKLTLARMILDEFQGQTSQSQAETDFVETGFDALRRLLPQIERITLTDQDLAGVALNGPMP